jgi:hypothetical protein
MRKRKPTNGRVPGVKFRITEASEDNDLKKVKKKLLKELEEKEKNKKDWYDKELANILNRDPRGNS